MYFNAIATPPPSISKAAKNCLQEKRRQYIQSMELLLAPKQTRLWLATHPEAEGDPSKENYYINRNGRRTQQHNVHTTSSESVSPVIDGGGEGQFSCHQRSVFGEWLVIHFYS